MPKKTKEKYYVVFEGRQRGIYSTWNECESQVKGFKGAQFKSYTSKELAENTYQQHLTAYPLPLHEDGLRYELTDGNNDDNELHFVEDTNGNEIENNHNEIQNEMEIELKNINDNNIPMEEEKIDNQNEMIEEEDDNNIIEFNENENELQIGIIYKQHEKKRGLVRIDTKQIVVRGNESVELYRKGLLYLFYSHLLEIGYKLYISHEFYKQLIMTDLPLPLKKNIDSFILFLD